VIALAVVHGSSAHGRAALLGRLAVLIPPPRVHTVRYYGVFAPRSKLRRLVVPARAVAAADGAESLAAAGAARCHRCTSWAQLLARVFALDILACPRCGQQGMQQIAGLASFPMGGTGCWNSLRPAARLDRGP
jgi:hypothetical protein